MAAVVQGDRVEQDGLAARLLRSGPLPLVRLSPRSLGPSVNGRGVERLDGRAAEHQVLPAPAASA